MGVLEDVVGGVDVGDHDELAVALQRRLEQVRQLRVTVLWTASIAPTEVVSQPRLAGLP